MNYPLLENAFSRHDLNEGIKVLKSKNSLWEKLQKFLRYLQKIGAKYALMVNSGSSANLLMLSALVNPLYKKGLRRAMKF